MIPALAEAAKNTKNAAARRDKNGKTMARLSVTHFVRRFCLECQGDSLDAVRGCTEDHCALWAHRLQEQAAPGSDAITSAEQKTKLRENTRRALLRAVRRHCLTCAVSRAEVRACAARESCALWSFRFGVRPETYRAVRERCSRPKNLSLFT